ncbi:MAG: recombinase family protein [Actinobacteria bacterium]|nr:recombinase family protein [Actinomycetota bacterium]
MNHKVTYEHLARKAVIYIRQSSPDQVKNNLESQRRQYALAEKAREIGFAQVETIDEDLGRSGASAAGRSGFRRLVASVSLKEVGAIFSIEASRLSRNNRDWAQLVELCSLTDTLIIDHDGVYDPRILNDRLLLGLKGTMSEYELGLIRQRAHAALREMASRGALVTTLPVGYVKDGSHVIKKDPDLRVQQAISLVFAKFAELGSVRQTHLFLRQEGIRLPAIVRMPEGPQKEWKLPVYNTVLHILKNPIYCGAYAYGRSGTKIGIEEGSAVKVRGFQLPRKEWQAFIPNHHEGYINLSEWERNQRMIEENAAQRGSSVKGPARSGRSLLAGLLRCRRCGRKLHVSYSGKDGKVPRYSCQGAHLNHGTQRCISFGGLAADKAVEEEVLSALSPEAIRASLEGWDGLERRRNEHRRALELALEQAEYEARRAFRQYDRIEPENRLVAAELERILEERLGEVEHLKCELEKMPAEKPLGGEEREALLSLAFDFPSVWDGEQTDMAKKKRLVRILIEEIYVDVDDDAALIHLTIRWAGGCHTELEVRKNRTGEHRHTTDRDVVEIVRELAKVASDADIARILNRLGKSTGKGNTWTEGRIRSLRSYHKIEVFSPERKACEGWLNMAEAATYLGVSVMSARRLLERGVIKGKQAVPYAPWVIEREDLETCEVKEAVSAIKKGGRTEIGVGSDQEGLCFVDA